MRSVVRLVGQQERDFLGVGGGIGSTPSRRPRCGRGSRSVRTEASRECVPRTRTGSEPCPQALPQVPFRTRVRTCPTLHHAADNPSSRDAPRQPGVRAKRSPPTAGCNQEVARSGGSTEARVALRDLAGAEPARADGCDEGRPASTSPSPSPSGTPRRWSPSVRRVACRPDRAPPSRNSSGSKCSQPSPSMYAACALSDSTPAAKVAVVSTPCPDWGEDAAHTSRTPPHGARPASICSGKTQRFPASRTASRVALPVAMWSAWFRLRPPQVSRKLLVITISGWCRRTTAQIARRSGTPYSSTPSGRPRKSTTSTPTISAEATCSDSRTRRASAGASPSMPASPLVTMAYTTRLPWPVQRATAAAAPNSMSSGWATTQSALVQDSSTGSRSAMA